MSLNTLSRAPTLADVLAALETVEVPERRRQDMRSAVRCTARLLGQNPSEVPADPSGLGRRMAELSPQSHGITKTRWSNVRSLLRSALDIVRPMMKGRDTAALSPGWSRLYATLLGPTECTRLSSIMRWMSAAGVEPMDLTPTHIERFKTDLLSNSLRRRPEKTWTDLVLCWNRLVHRNPTFPQLRIDPVSRRNTYILPWSQLPTSLKADVDAWLDRLAGRDFSDDGPVRPVRPETLKFREYQLRAFASALVHRGTDPATLVALADLVRHDAFVSGLRFHYDRRGRSSSSIEGLAGMLKSVARHWVKLDTDTLAKLTVIQRRLAVPAKGLTDKNRDRLRVFDDEENVTKLLSLPERLRRTADRCRSVRQAAVLASTAVAIELLIVAPVRLSNLVAIEIDRHLIRVGRKRHLIFPAHEVKNRTDLEFDLPVRTADLIDWYLRVHRPLLSGPSHNALFPGHCGAPKTKGLLGAQISAAVFQYTGLRVNPHLFRHIAAKLYLDAAPGNYEVMRRVLGHKALDTTVRFYAGMETRAAIRHFDEVILKRQSSGTSAKLRSTAL